MSPTCTTCISVVIVYLCMCGYFVCLSPTLGSVKS
jgi:hypothetical protein